MQQNRYAKNEALLLSSLKKGEESAYRYVFDNYYDRLVFFANKMLNDIDSSRNVVQEVIVMVFDKRDELNIHTSLNSFLHQVVRNRVLNLLKHEKIKSTHHAEMLHQSENYDVENRAEYNDLQDAIKSIVSELPPRCKEIFELSRVDGKSNQEIAEELEISKRTVETQISNALKQLRLGLKKLELLPFFMFLLLIQYVYYLFSLSYI